MGWVSVALVVQVVLAVVPQGVVVMVLMGVQVVPVVIQQ